MGRVEQPAVHPRDPLPLRIKSHSDNGSGARENPVRRAQGRSPSFACPSRIRTTTANGQSSPTPDRRRGTPRQTGRQPGQPWGRRRRAWRPPGAYLLRSDPRPSVGDWERMRTTSCWAFVVRRARSPPRLGVTDDGGGDEGVRAAVARGGHDWRGRTNVEQNVPL